MKSLWIGFAAIVFTLAAGRAPAEEAAPAGEAAPAKETVVKRPLTVEDLWSMQRVGSPAVSPDGGLVAFTVTAFDVEENRGEGDLWLAPSDGSEPARRLTWQKGADSSPAWSPDGKHLAFVSKRGEGPRQLYLLPMAGGEAGADHRVADFGR